MLEIIGLSSAMVLIIGSNMSKYRRNLPVLLHPKISVSRLNLLIEHNELNFRFLMKASSLTGFVEKVPTNSSRSSDGINNKI